MVCVGSSVGPRTGVSVSSGYVPAGKASVPRSALPSRKNVESLADSSLAFTCESCPHAEHGGKPSRLTSLLRVGEVAKILGISRSTI